MFVEETVKETSEELVIVGIVGILRLTESRNDLVDGDFLLVHSFVEGVAFGFDFGGESRDRHAGFGIRVFRGEIHETRVELKTLSSNFFEQFDVGSGEEFVTVQAEISNDHEKNEREERLTLLEEPS